MWRLGRLVLALVCLSGSAAPICPQTDDFEIVFNGTARFTAARNGTCFCSGHFRGDGRLLTDVAGSVLGSAGSVAAQLDSVTNASAAVAAQFAVAQQQLTTLLASPVSQDIAAINSLSVRMSALLRLGSCAAFAAPSCLDLRGRPGYSSGFYWIAASPVAQRVWCDFVTDGGGWTQVWKPYGNADLNTVTSTWPLGFGGPNNLIARSSYMMFAFTDTTNVMVTTVATPWKFPTPSQFISQSPFDVAGCLYISINATRIADGTSTIKTLRAGYSSFGAYCDDGCASQWGQICLKSTTTQGVSGGHSDFPMYSTWAVAGNDHCARSNQVYTAASCNVENLFTIYVR